MDTQEILSKKALRLHEIFNLLYGDIFPKAISIEYEPEKPNSITIEFSPKWKGVFTYNGPRDFNLVF